jgi:tetratricopeptide (TPR) repeat protein
MNRIEEAVDALEKIIKGPGSKTVPKEIQARGWYELGLIYQHKKGDFEKARECYDNVIKTGADPNLADLAKGKIAAIDQLKEADKKLASLKGQSGKSVDSIHYNYGEVYWLRLSEADSALNHFLAICADTRADSGFVMKSMYASAWILRFIKNDTTRSDSIYSAIIKRYPATNVAQRAQQDLGVPVTVLTRQDSGLQAFVDAEKLYFDDQDPVGAVNAYYKVAKKYRDIPYIAAHSIYAAGWICSNVLSKNTKAFMLFKMLCDSFPNTELCEKGAKQQVKFVEDTLKIIQTSKKKETGKTQKAGKTASGTIKTQETDTSDLLMTDEGKQNVQSTPLDTSKHTLPDTARQDPGVNTIQSPQPPADTSKKSMTDTTKKQNQNLNTSQEQQKDQIQQQKEVPVQNQF